MKNCSKPCSECPFGRKTKAGLLGGADPTVYIGQARGPFVLSCHKDPDYEQSTALEKHAELKGCAGAAIYRANNGLDKLMPKELYSLPENHAAAFSSPAELLAHHSEITLEEAEAFLKALPQEYWLAVEMSKLSKKNFITGHNSIDDAAPMD